MTIRANAEDFGEEFVAACEAAARGEEVFLVRDGVRLASLIPLPLADATSLGSASN